MGLSTVCVFAAAAVDSNPTAFGGGASASTASPKRLGLVLDVSALYVLQGGSSFDGRHGYVILPDHVAHLPKLSGGFGVRPGVGVVFRRVLPAISVMATLNLDWSRHAATGYNAGGVAYEREHSSLVNTSLELRAVLDRFAVKPFLALAPGYGWLSLPKAVTIIEPITRDTTWADLRLHGASLALLAGASFPFTDWLSAEASVGVRFQSYTSASVGTVSNLGMSPGFLGALGLSLSL